MLGLHEHLLPQTHREGNSSPRLLPDFRETVANQNQPKERSREVFRANVERRKLRKANFATPEEVLRAPGPHDGLPANQKVHPNLLSNSRGHIL